MSCDVDGFALKLTAGSGNYFYGCRAFDSLTLNIILRKFDMPEQGKALPIGLKFR